MQAWMHVHTKRKRKLQIKFTTRGLHTEIKATISSSLIITDPQIRISKNNAWRYWRPLWNIQMTKRKIKNSNMLPLKTGTP